MPDNEQTAAATAEPALPTQLNNASDLAAFLTQRTARSTPTAEGEANSEQANPEAEETVTENAEEAEGTDPAVEAEDDTVPADPEEAAPEAEAEEEGEEAPPSGTPAWVTKRLAKMAAQKAERDATIAAQKAELDALKASKSQPEADITPAPAAPNDRLGFIRTATELAEWQRNANLAVGAIDEFLDSDGQDVSKGQLAMLEVLAKSHDLLNNDGELSLPKLRKARRQFGEILSSDVPNKYAWFQEEPRQSALAEAKFQWWKNKDSEEFKIAQNALKINPGIRQFPDWKNLISLWVKGVIVDRNEFLAAKKAEAAKTAKPKAKPTKVGLAVAKAAPSERPKAATAAAATRAFSEQPFSVQGLAQLLQARAAK